jgi:hypothetical protein
MMASLSITRIQLLGGSQGHKIGYDGIAAIFCLSK